MTLLVTLASSHNEMCTEFHRLTRLHLRPLHAPTIKKICGAAPSSFNDPIHIAEHYKLMSLQ